MPDFMDLKLSEEQKLIKETAARFVDKELIGREGAYLKQREPFLPPGDPARRDLDAAVRQELTEQARRVGLWSLELPENLGGSAMSAIDRVLIHREFGRSVLPFRPISIPGFMFESKYGADLAAGNVDAIRWPLTKRTRPVSLVVCKHCIAKSRPVVFCAIRPSTLSIRTPTCFYFRRGNKVRDGWVVCHRTRHAGSGHRR